MYAVVQTLAQLVLSQLAKNYVEITVSPNERPRTSARFPLTPIYSSFGGGGEG